jgi:hypothetical protein
MKKLKYILSTLLIVGFFSLIQFSGTSFASATCSTPDGGGTGTANICNADCPSSSSSAAGQSTGTPNLSTPNASLKNNCIITRYVKPAVQFLSAGVGVVVIIMIVIGAIQYIAAGDNPQATAAAKKRIISALIALLTYALLFSLLNFLIPGGLIQI